MNQNGIFRRRLLPHWDVPDKPYFITACLEGSISSVGLKRIRQYRDELDARPRPPKLSESEWELHKDKLVFALVDNLLDNQSPVRHLADERQAEVVQNAFLHFANERYALLAYVVMPSHHHWLFLPNEQWSQVAVAGSLQAGGPRRTPREIISHSIQSDTATQCNRIREATGCFWQNETFDHWVRDEGELHRIMAYIEHNPVAAGLVERPVDYRWSSARLRQQLKIPLGQPLRNPVA